MDGGKIVGGIVMVLAMATGPLWVGSAGGVRETPVPPRTDAGCVEPREQMRADHPALLANWRERAVRLGQRSHRSADGRDLPIALTGTCLGCHGAASQFCDRCHAQHAVTLSCWQCHAPFPQDPQQASLPWSR